MKSCMACHSKKLVKLINGGLHPVSNRFLKTLAEKQPLFPLILGQCRQCGLIQLLHFFPEAQICPKFGWITYTEPESHLDELVDIVMKKYISSQSKILGFTYKDRSTLERFRERNVENVYELNPYHDLGIASPLSGIEAIQNHFTKRQALHIKEKQGTFDIIILRHILEHVFNIHEFMSALKTLSKPEGIVIIEVPDCTRSLESGDCTMLWEEHSIYFTPHTFENTLSTHGFRLISLLHYPYPLENSLVAIVKRSPKNSMPKERNFDLARMLNLSNTYVSKLNDHQKHLVSLLRRHKNIYGNIAIFGAGHLSAMFINFYGFGDFIDFVVDDNIHKKDLYMPGSRIPIVSSDQLLTRNIHSCLLGVNPLNEDMLVKKNIGFIKKGGKFFSIFPTSNRYFATHMNLK